MSDRFIEDFHELKLQRRIADIRPWTAKLAEQLADKFILLLLSLPLLLFAAVFPLSSLLLLPLVGAMIVSHRNNRPVMPMRYPAINPEPDPVSGKPGKGIMFFGNQESKNQLYKFIEIWASDDDLRKHMLILGSTGSGKSETLKSMFFNALCWSSGFFIADGKADNKLPTDVYTMVRSVGMDDNLFHLNFLLSGKTPEQVRLSRRRRTNKLNPFTSADADTIIQMGANMLPKVEGEGKNWQEKALNLWRALVVALCYKRDTQGFALSVSTLVDYMSLTKIEELYIEGFDEAREMGEWSYGFASIKTYLDSGCPAYKVDKLLAKAGRDGSAQAPQAGGFGGARAGGGKNNNDQDSMAYEQHAYRTSQLMPVLNLLDKTYGHIFRDKYPEIDMVDVTLNNRIMTMLIPSLEKSAQEAENLGKLAIACLRVMMARNLGAGVEGSRRELLESKATMAKYPYLVALDELGYYFSDGIAVIFAQARSLGFCMIPAAQDLEKLTEGNRAAEAGAMMANAVTKIFLRIDDAKKTFEFVQGIIGKATVAVYRNFEVGALGWERRAEIDIQEIDRATMRQLQAFEPGQGLFNALGKTTRFRSYYMDQDLTAHRADEFYVLRFLQVRPPTPDEVLANTIPASLVGDGLVRGERLRSILSHETRLEPVEVAPHPALVAAKQASLMLPEHVRGDLRAAVLFEAARQGLAALRRQTADESRALGLGGLAGGGLPEENSTSTSTSTSATVIARSRDQGQGQGRRHDRGPDREQERLAQTQGSEQAGEFDDLMPVRRQDSMDADEASEGVAGRGAGSTSGSVELSVRDLFGDDAQDDGRAQTGSAGSARAGPGRLDSAVPPDVDVEDDEDDDDVLLAVASSDPSSTPGSGWQDASNGEQRQQKQSSSREGAVPVAVPREELSSDDGDADDDEPVDLDEALLMVAEPPFARKAVQTILQAHHGEDHARPGAAWSEDDQSTALDDLFGVSSSGAGVAAGTGKGHAGHGSHDGQASDASDAGQSAGSTAHAGFGHRDTGSQREIEAAGADPVQAFLLGVRHFSMPRVLDVPDPALATAAERRAFDSAIDQVLASGGSARQPGAGRGPGQSASAAPAQDDGAWIDRAVNFSAQGSQALVRPRGGAPGESGRTPGAQSGPGVRRSGARSAPEEVSYVGFGSKTQALLVEMEGTLGSKNPELAVRVLEETISSAITPALRPDVEASDDMIAAIMSDLDLLGKDQGAE